MLARLSILVISLVSSLIIVRAAPKIMKEATGEAMEATFLSQAKFFCLPAMDFDGCVEDVIKTGQLRMADLYIYSHSQLIQGRTGDVDLVEEAYVACAVVRPLEFELCIEDVLDTGDFVIVAQFPKTPTGNDKDKVGQSLDTPPRLRVVDELKRLEKKFAHSF